MMSRSNWIALTDECARVYGYPVEIRKGSMGLLASGKYGGLWVSVRHNDRADVRRGARFLLYELSRTKSMELWRPWVKYCLPLGGS